MMINSWRFWLSVGTGILLLALMVYYADVGKISGALAHANYWYVAPAVALYFAAVYFRSLRWVFLLSPLASLKVSRLFGVVSVGYMANNLLPARLGELVRAYVLARRERVSGSAAVATIAVERVYDGLTLLAFAAVSAPFLLLLGELDSADPAYRTTGIVVAASLVVVFLGIGAVLTLANFPWFSHGVDWVIDRSPGRFRPGLRGMALGFIEGLAILSSPKKHLVLFVLSLPVWLLEGGTYFLICYSFGIDRFFDSLLVLALVALLLTATSNLAAALPTSIGGIGPFEVAAQQTLVALGVGASVGAAYAGFLHLVVLWLPVNLVGLAFWWRQHLSMGELIDPNPLRNPRPARPEPAVVPGKDKP